MKLSRNSLQSIRLTITINVVTTKIYFKLWFKATYSLNSLFKHDPI